MSGATTKRGLVDTSVAIELKELDPRRLPDEISISALTLAELQAKIAKHAWEDPAFEAEFMTDPKATFEKYTGRPLPDALSVRAHYNTPTELHYYREGGILPAVLRKMLASA